ncbi:hypothetical protein [Mucilaginibacter flavidus]|uniref:hypothetical protein n=1 Tax=Mucilaginibacter flavidus TaxID=2949309 RepID=UPI0020922A20|nr:hypothetical protein [Mucilaginibacter flavidus]MCO5951174.1 hypothetical protein [Mucilaginibacter flavidus]
MELPVIDIIVEFVTSIGLEVVKRPVNQDTFLPGLLLEGGKIIIDTNKLQYPGDILHEAGHLAACDADTRNTIGSPLPEYMDGGFEMLALAWSYAACLHIGLPASVVFHNGGYKGEGEHLLQTFANGSYIGLPMLQYRGLAYDKKKSAEMGVLPYPNMVRWLH